MDELREAMNAAWDESEAEGDAVALEKEDSELEIKESVIAAEENSDSKLESEQDLSHENDKQTDEKAHESKEKDAEIKEEETTKVAKTSKAPASWSPKAREAWDKVPADAQAQIAKREIEVNQVLQQSAGARKAAESLNAVLAPYREGLQSAGYQDPFQAISTLLQAESGLRAGSSYDRAMGIANLINHYGVDISQLDGILSGQPKKNSPNTAMEDMLDERMAPINQFLQQQQQQQQQGEIQQQQQAHESVVQFGADKEFLEDVRMDMANLMDGAGNRGEQMSMEQAYKIACQINPEVAQIMQQRLTQQNIMGTNQTALQKKAAAVSLTGNKGGAGGVDGSLSLRDTIATAWNEQVG